VETLSRLSTTSRGALAVATRGAGRQLQRTLEKMGPLPSRQADEMLLSSVRVLLTCAGQSHEVVGVLRRQGLADVVVKCDDAVENKVEAAHSSGGTSSNESGQSSANNASVSSAKGGKQSKKSASSSSSSKSGSSDVLEASIAASTYLPEPSTTSSIREDLSALLSILMTRAELQHALGSIAVIASDMEVAVNRVASKGTESAELLLKVKVDGFNSGELRHLLRKSALALSISRGDGS